MVPQLFHNLTEKTSVVCPFETTSSILATGTIVVPFSTLLSFSFDFLFLGNHTSSRFKKGASKSRWNVTARHRVSTKVARNS